MSRTVIRPVAPPRLRTLALGTLVGLLGVGVVFAAGVASRGLFPVPAPAPPASDVSDPPLIGTGMEPLPTVERIPTGSSLSSETDWEPPKKPSEGCPAYAVYDSALARARKAAADKRYDDAIRSYHDAVFARPYDARARWERAHVRMLAGMEVSEEELELAYALASGRNEPALRAQIAYDMGLLHEANGEEEAARVDFVRAERHGSPAAAAKLAGKSRCTVTVTTEGRGLELADSWRAVYRRMADAPLCAVQPPAATESEARAYACGGCSGKGEPWREGACDAAGPWTVSSGYMGCSPFSTLIVPFSRGRYYVELGGQSHTVPEHEGKRWVFRSPEHYWSWVAFFGPGVEEPYRIGEGWGREAWEFGHRCPADERSWTELEMASGCDASAGAGYDRGTTATYYDDDGRFLAKVRFDAGDEERVNVRFVGHRLLVNDKGAAGPGCDLSVALSR